MERLLQQFSQTRGDRKKGEKNDVMCALNRQERIRSK